MSDITTLTQRADFLRAARGAKARAGGLVLQGWRRDPQDQQGRIRVGFTCSKKVGNAVARNRAKRRLRAAARSVLPEFGHTGWDYVLIGLNVRTAERPWVELLEDLRSALAHIHARRK